MIRERDYEILRAFLNRESLMYNWAVTGENGRTDFVDRLFDRITRDYGDTVVFDEKLDYIHIQSITNMGLVDSQLVLTAEDWGPGKSAYLSLPPSPKGGIGFHVKEGR